MATSFIEYNNKGFWNNDTFTEVSVEYLITVILKHTVEDWMTSYINEVLKPISKGHFPAFIDMGFNEYLTDDNRKAIFIEFINETVDFLKLKGNLISAQELNSYIVNERLQSKWTKGLSTSLIIETLEKFKMVINEFDIPEE